MEASNYCMQAMFVLVKNLITTTLQLYSVNKMYGFIEIGLFGEPISSILGAKEVPLEELKCDETLEFRVPRLVDCPHAAFAGEGIDAEVPNSLTDHVNHLPVSGMGLKLAE